MRVTNGNKTKVKNPLQITNEKLLQECKQTGLSQEHSNGWSKDIANRYCTPNR